MALSSGTGLGRYDRKSDSFRYYTNDPSNPNSIISNWTNRVCIDRSNNLWIGTNDRGVSSISLDQIYNQANPEFTNYSDLSGSINTAIYEDKFQSVWIGSYTIYMKKYERNQSPFIWYRPNRSNSNSLSSYGVESIFVDSHNNISSAEFGLEVLIMVLI